ncbi:MAG TPA: hypothetical protein VFF37_17155 [Streptomyces sp.]|nr:hypothetical protein [Streptomyces sp.]
MDSIGIGICSAEHGYDPMQARYGVVAAWPLSTYRDARQPSIRACREHLAEAIAGLAAGSP